MADLSQGFNLPTTYEAEPLWQNPARVLEDDEEYASVTVKVQSDIQDVDILFVRGFDLNIPPSIIRGVEIEIKAFGNNANNYFRINPVLDRVNKGGAKSISLSTTPTIYTAGGPTDLWQLNSTNSDNPETLNNPLFGFQITPRTSSNEGTYIHQIDYLMAKIYYEAALPGAAALID